MSTSKSSAAATVALDDIDGMIQLSDNAIRTMRLHRSRRILSRLRDIFWTFRHRGDPITVYFYTSSRYKEPFRACVYRRIANGLVFTTEIPRLGVFGRLSTEFSDYGTTWCWGHEGEEVEALAVSRALA